MKILNSKTTNPSQFNKLSKDQLKTVLGGAKPPKEENLQAAQDKADGLFVEHIGNVVLLLLF